MKVQTSGVKPSPFSETPMQMRAEFQSEMPRACLQPLSEEQEGAPWCLEGYGIAWGLSEMGTQPDVPEGSFWCM